SRKATDVQSTKQVRVVAQDAPRPGQSFEHVAFFDADGEPIELGGGGGGAVAWDDVTDKPSTFPPESHTHAASDITDLATVATSGSYDDLSDTPAIPSTPGDVRAAPATHTPAASDITDLAAVATSGSYGDLSDTPAIPSTPGDVGAAPASHTHDIEDVTGLQAVIND